MGGHWPIIIQNLNKCLYTTRWWNFLQNDCPYIRFLCNCVDRFICQYHPLYLICHSPIPGFKTNARSGIATIRANPWERGTHIYAFTSTGQYIDPVLTTHPCWLQKNGVKNTGATHYTPCTIQFACPSIPCVD